MRNHQPNVSNVPFNASNAKIAIYMDTPHNVDNIDINCRLSKFMIYIYIYIYIYLDKCFCSFTCTNILGSYPDYVKYKV